MPVKTPRPGDLEPIETASRDELVSLQLSRLARSLRQAYDNVAHYRRALDAAPYFLWESLHESGCRGRQGRHRAVDRTAQEASLTGNLPSANSMS